MQPEVMGTYLPGAGTLGWVVWPGSGIARSLGVPPNFYPLHMNVGLPVPHLSRALPLLPVWMSECDFFKSLVVILPYSSIF